MELSVSTSVLFISAVIKISTKNVYICINFYSYSRIGTVENNMKIKTV